MAVGWETLQHAVELCIARTRGIVMLPQIMRVIRTLNEYDNGLQTPASAPCGDPSRMDLVSCASGPFKERYRDLRFDRSLGD